MDNVGLSRFSCSENGTVPCRNREAILRPPPSSTKFIVKARFQVGERRETPFVIGRRRI
jgi:hypothetical protein